MFIKSIKEKTFNHRHFIRSYNSSILGFSVLPKVMSTSLQSHSCSVHKKGKTFILPWPRADIFIIIYNINPSQQKNKQKSYSLLFLHPPPGGGRLIKEHLPTVSTLSFFLEFYNYFVFITESWCFLTDDMVQPLI